MSANPQASTRARGQLGFAEYALTAGQLGAASCQTVVVALLPLLLRPATTSAFGIGFSVGGEGLFALLLPLLVGRATDALRVRQGKRIGRRSLFLVVATPVSAAALVALPWASGYWQMTALAFVYFAAQQLYLTPLMTLVVDALPDHKRARAQGMRSVYQALGLSYGFVGGGLLFPIWSPLPFIVAALLLCITTAASIWAEHRLSHARAPGTRGVGGVRQLVSELRRRPSAAWLLVANALWNSAIDGCRPYAFVYATQVLDVSIAQAALALSVLMLSIVVAALVFGKLGDRRDRARLLMIGTSLMSVAMLAGVMVRHPLAALPVLMLAGIGAAATMTLPYPLFAALMGERSVGQYSGLFVVSVSVGRVVSPMLFGAVIDAGSRWLPQTHGYPLMWPAAALLAGLGLIALQRSRRQQRVALQPSPQRTVT